MDSYRQYSGPAHLAGKRVISSKAGAEIMKAYQQTIPELLWSLERSFAGSVNQFVLHGYPTSSGYGNTTWPGFATFAYLFSDMHGPRQPAFSFYSDFLDWLSRNQYIGQRGIPKVDIAFWSKSTSYKTIPTVYSSEDLQEAGYTYEYLSPDNFALQEAYVSNGVFAPNRQAFKVLVVQSGESLTTAGVSKLVEYAQNGLTVIFFWWTSSNYSGYNPKAANSAAASLEKLGSLNTVHMVLGGTLAATLQSLNIAPRTSVSSNATCDAPGLSPEQGDVTSMSTYQQSPTHITVPLQLATNRSIIVAFHQSSQSGPHAQNTADGIVPVEANGNPLTVLRSYDEQTRSIKLSNGKFATLKPMTSQPSTLGDWTLVVESWTPPSDMYNIAARPQRTNSSYQLSTLLPWNEVSSRLANVSGIWYYSTSFWWPPVTNADDLVSGAISHTATVTVNGQILPPVDLIWAKHNICSLLKQGENIVEVVVSTPLGNVLRNYWDELETGGKFATATMLAVPDEAAYGLPSPVKIVPYRKDQVA
ncbi:Hypothetical protein PENO1_082490 [Penicillium occitanis (nom. inval.)]|nr:hypothetical protein PENOC_087840 [Penicillium occitanis (nom. inval.)]PCG93636.1 Hypothetical protein PENO1_082490 [Penicillium occitanis (nom. inval.)]